MLFLFIYVKGRTGILQFNDTIRDPRLRVGVAKKLYTMIYKRFSLRSNPDKSGLPMIYLKITHKKSRVRISLNLKVPEKNLMQLNFSIACCFVKLFFN